MTIPAPIRNCNPGAMWGRTGKRPSLDKFVPTNYALAVKWGSIQTEYLNDGLGQGNNIAKFPDNVHGACAQFDLWRTSKNYADKSLINALTTWSGGNHTLDYVAFVIKRVPGITKDTIINSAFLASPSGVLFVKAQAWHESGQPFPMTDDEWKRAQSMVFGLTPVEIADDPTPLILVGSTGSAVSKMQKLLQCKETGSYEDNSETKFALQLFQVRNGLKPDGKCGQLTWTKLEPNSW